MDGSPLPGQNFFIGGESLVVKRMLVPASGRLSRSECVSTGTMSKCVYVYV